ncbi:MAG: DUF4238 domain-containing protein [Patescibacteria group bacterium]|jgi:hypothetical protein
MRSKRHHYVPQFELEYFSNDDFVWVYDRKQDEFRHQRIKDTAVISNYYSFTTPSGEVDDGLEKALSIGEGIAAQLIKKINKGDWRMTPQDRLEFSTYLALKMLRTPSHQKKSETLFEAMIKVETRKLANDEKKFTDAMKYVEKETGKKITDLEGQKEFMLDPKRYKVETTRLTSLQTMVTSLKDAYQAIYGMYWVFRYAPKGYSYITSDNPFFIKPYFPTNNRLACGLFTPHTVTFVILTPKVCLTLLRRDKIGQAAGKVNREMINEVNNDVGLFSTRFLFSHNERLLKKIVERTNLPKTKPYKIIIEVDDGIKERFKVTSD